MTMNQDDQLFCTIHDYVVGELEGPLEPQQRQAFESLLRDDERARRIYVEYMHELASLRWSYAHRSDCHVASFIGDVDMDSRSVVRTTWKGKFDIKTCVRWAFAASLVLLGLGWAFAVFHQRMDDHRAVATITRVSGAQWKPNTVAPSEFARLRTGQTLHLESGHVELVFDKSVEVVLEGPTHFQITSESSAFSRLGSISARVGRDAVGFTVQTPRARVIDLGTEFGVVVHETGETEVAVFDGDVDLDVERTGHSARREPKQRLTRGEAVRVGIDGGLHRLFAIASDHFPSALATRQPASDRSPLITDVRDNLRDPTKKYYKIVREGLAENSQAFVDRVHQWNGIDATGMPGALLGAEYVMLFNDDKHQADDFEVRLSVASPTTLFIFLSDALEPPDWLTARFLDTGDDIGLDEGKSRWHQDAIPPRSLGSRPGESIDTVFSIWRSDVPTARDVVLGGVERPVNTDGYNMYGIAAIPLSE
ncbi:MAG: FecR domain-containing protein [Planctomycetota bacterium]